MVSTQAVTVSTVLPTSEHKVVRTQINQHDIQQPDGTISAGGNQNITAHLLCHAQHSTRRVETREVGKIDQFKAVDCIKVGNGVVPMACFEYETVGVEITNQQIITRPADQRVESCTAVQRILAILARQDVIACPAKEPVVACPAPCGVVALFAEMTVIACSADQLVIAVSTKQPVQPLTAKQGVRASAPIKIVSLIAAVHHVIPVAAIQKVKTCVAEQRVIALLTPEAINRHPNIGSGTDPIVPRPTIQAIRRIARPKTVIAIVPIKLVKTCAADQNVVVVAAKQGIRVIFANQRIVAILR